VRFVVKPNGDYLGTTRPSYPVGVSGIRLYEQEPVR